MSEGEICVGNDGLVIMKKGSNKKKQNNTKFLLFKKLSKIKNRNKIARKKGLIISKVNTLNKYR
jgi:hypothetical protein